MSLELASIDWYAKPSDAELTLSAAAVVSWLDVSTIDAVRTVHIPRNTFRGAASHKWSNLLASRDKLIELGIESAGLGAAAVGAAQTLPSVVPLLAATLLIIKRAYDLRKVPVGETDASVLLGALNFSHLVSIDEQDLLAETNKERAQRGMPELSLPIVRDCLNHLAALRAVQRTHDDPPKWRVEEAIEIAR